MPGRRSRLDVRCLAVGGGDAIGREGDGKPGFANPHFVARGLE